MPMNTAISFDVDRFGFVFSFLLLDYKTQTIEASMKNGLRVELKLFRLLASFYVHKARVLLVSGH